MSEKAAEPSTGAKLGLEPADGPMTDFCDVSGPCGTMQTIGPNARELERRRLHAGGRAQRLAADAPLGVAAAGDDVRAGRMRPNGALDALSATVRDIFSGQGRS